eukprot:scaffold4089_cov172-Pinguiococcus_pyrenoidosus.AAC.1
MEPLGLVPNSDTRTIPHVSVSHSPGGSSLRKRSVAVYDAVRIAVFEALEGVLGVLSASVALSSE